MGDADGDDDVGGRIWDLEGEWLDLEAGEVGFLRVLDGVFIIW